MSDGRLLPAVTCPRGNLGVRVAERPRKRVRVEAMEPAATGASASSWEPAPRLQPHGAIAPRPRFQAPPVGSTNRGTPDPRPPVLPMTPPTIPSAPTRHYGPTTPMNEQGLPMTPLIPTAPGRLSADNHWKKLQWKRPWRRYLGRP